MTSISVRERQRERRSLREPRGRDWNSAATSQGTPGDTRGHEKQERILSWTL